MIESSNRALLPDQEYEYEEEFSFKENLQLLLKKFRIIEFCQKIGLELLTFKK